MGVPVLVLDFARTAQNIGVYLLPLLGLQDWLLDSPEAYVQRAVKISQQPEILSELRFTLRERLRFSAICQPQFFVRDLEQAYRKLWQQWCAQQRVEL